MAAATAVIRVRIQIRAVAAAIGNRGLAIWSEGGADAGTTGADGARLDCLTDVAAATAVIRVRTQIEAAVAALSVLSRVADEVASSVGADRP